MFDDRSPIYRQIAERIIAEILDGTLRAGEQVMSTNEYASFFRINPATAAKAFQLLVDDNILFKRRGIGMFVAEEARKRLLARHRARFFTDVVDPMLDEARAIDIDLSEIIAYLQRQERKEAE